MLRCLEMGEGAGKRESDMFRQNLRMSIPAFDRLLELICADEVFVAKGYRPQIRVERQLAIALFRFGSEGNRGSLEDAARFSGYSKGAMTSATARVVHALGNIKTKVLRWPDEEEKEIQKEQVEKLSCAAWRDGYCMVDGTLVKLAKTPKYKTEAFNSRKLFHALNVQVSFLRESSSKVLFTEIPPAGYQHPRSSHNRRGGRLPGIST